MEEEKKRGRGRPSLTEEEKRERALARKNGELAPGKKKFGEEMVQAGDITTEYDKLIDRQLERAAITSIAGFGKICDGAACVLNV